MKHRLCYIKNAVLFSRLKQDELQRLASRSERVEYKRNTNFYFAHEQSNSIFQEAVGLYGLKRKFEASRTDFSSFAAP